MLTPTLAKVFEATVVLSSGASLVLGAWTLTRPNPETPELRSRSQAPSQASRLGRAARHPLTQLALVCLLLWINQILFSAHVLRAHHGDTSFIGRFIGHGWFAIDAKSSLVRIVAAHSGDGTWLSPTVLRVQAFLELPFTLFAYLAVARLLGSDLYRKLTSLPILFLTSISWSVTFSIVELVLQNPYTTDDIVLRALSTLIVPVYVARISKASLPARDDGPKGLLGLLSFLAGAGAIAYVVLAVYDAFLLYNLAHLPRYANGIAAALLIAGAASAMGPRVDELVAGRSRRDAPPSPAIDVCVSSLRTFTLFFFVPSLAIRYRGHMDYAVLSGMLLVGTSLAVGAGAALRRVIAKDEGALGSVATLALSGVAAGFAGVWAAWGAILTAPHGPITPELVLARVALSFLLASIVTFRAAEIAVCWARHEAKAPADEA